MPDNNQSILSKVNKTRAQKAAKNEKHRQNVAHRASLQSQKANAGGQAEAIQKKIDGISKGYHL